MPEPLEDIAARISACRAGDQPRLRGSLRAIVARVRAGAPYDRALAKLEAAIAQAQQALTQRRDNRPPIHFPEDLPIVARRADIQAAIAAHQVVVICGDTGSGKSTQLPKMCLDMGRGLDGLIGHTQPRRIAARSLAVRVAEELRQPVGRAVGYKVRFDDRTRPDTYIKLMTDGILLAETQHDPLLRAYDTLILDEAHERSLNIDFLLGYLRRILPRRPELKLLITSATIDPESFSRFFRAAPVIEVSGRMYPVEVRYQPIEADALDEVETDLPGAVTTAVRTLTAEMPEGDGLVFLPGEREIRETAEALSAAHRPGTELLPLYARLSVEQQMKVFAPHRGRRIVLATNVAETSLTVPGIRFVVDAGLARISRYNPRSRVQRLPIEPISQASAQQRAGRCGRVGPGVCVRLYSEEDFQARARFTPPEILRTNLASVVLQMLALNLGDPTEFPFIDAPSRRLIEDGYQTLGELGAIDPGRRLTDLGRELARLPIDPRLGRMLLAARQERCLEEVLVIVAALATQDARARPSDKLEAADAAHAAFRHEESDFLGYLKLWEAYHQAAARNKSAALRRWCAEHYLSWVRLREWHDVHGQLADMFHPDNAPKSGREAGVQAARRMRPVGTMVPGRYDAIHRALLTGLLTNVGLRDAETGEYVSPHGSRFHIFPGSTLFRRTPRWVVAGEIVQTSRLYARTVARIKPIWIERLARHMLQRDYLAPFWDERSARVLGLEKVMYHGLVVQPGRHIPLGPVDPKTARDVFIQEGLVEGKYVSPGAFQKHNRELVAQLREWSVRLRRAVLAEESRLFDFYDQRIPGDVYAAPRFEAWRQRAERARPELLRLRREDLLLDPKVELSPTAYPDELTLAGLRVPLRYRWEADDPADGVTVTLPLPAAGQVSPGWLDYLVPGALPEKIAALLRTLPKALRVNFSPAAHYALAAAADLAPSPQPLTTALADYLAQRTGVAVQPGDFHPQALPAWMHMNVRIVDAQGAVLAEGRDLAQLQRDLAARIPASLTALGGEAWRRTGIRRWDFGDVPATVDLPFGAGAIRAHPTLADQGDSVSLRLVTRLDAAERGLHEGVRRLFLLELQHDLEPLVRGVDNFTEMALWYAPWGGAEELSRDMMRAVIERVFLQGQPGGPVVRSHLEYEWRLRAGWPAVAEEVRSLGAQAWAVLAAHQRVALKLAEATAPAWAASVADMQAQRAELVYPGFLLRTPAQRLPHLPRYLEAMTLRLSKLRSGGLARDMELLDQLTPWAQRWRQRCAAETSASPGDPALAEFRWMLEELRVSMFAQELGTAGPVSLVRLEKQWAQTRPSLSE